MKWGGRRAGAGVRGGGFGGRKLLRRVAENPDLAHLHSACALKRIGLYDAVL
jgi:hypothetical protein